MSIQGRLIVLSGLLVALPAGLLALNLAHARRLVGDAPMIDYAGSERMRAFMTAGLAAFSMRTPGGAARERIEHELADFERIRRGLLDGDAELGLKGTEDPRLRAELEEVGLLFVGYRAAVLSALDEAVDASSEERGARANEILSGAFGLYGFMDRVTRGLQQTSEDAVRRFRRGQSLLALALAAVGVAVLFGGRHFVLAPLPRFLEGLRSIERGDLRARLDDRGPAEFAGVARAFNAMGAALETARGELVAREDELAAKNRDLEHASRLKSEFLANMSHELRTPLNAVLGYAALLRRGVYGEVSPPQREALDGIAETGTHLLSLINDVLDLSKIEAGKMELRLERVELRPLLEDLARAVEPLVRGKGLAFRLAIEDGLPIVLTDADKVRRTLLNFLSNAIKFTKAGTVELRAAARGGGAVLVAVGDTGIGIPEADVLRLFEDFRQADGSATREYGGTGLGLSISLRLARMIGARIEVETGVGAGSTFALVLPRSPRPGSGGEVKVRARIPTAEADPRR